MVIEDFNPLNYIKDIFDIVDLIDLETCQLRWYSFERKGVSAEFNDGAMMHIVLDDIIHIEGGYVQSFKLTCTKSKLDLCKQLIAETKLDIEYLPIETTDDTDLIDVHFYVIKDFISIDEAVE